MALRSVSFKSVLDGVGARMGKTSDDITSEDRLYWMDLIDQRVRAVWEDFKWPELMKIEKRRFRKLYAAGDTYAAKDERYWPRTDKYYQALQASTGNPPETGDPLAVDNEYWAVCERTYSGDWYDAATAYVKGGMLRHEVDGLYYMCHTASTGNLPTDTSYFGVLTPFQPYIAWEQTGESKIGAVYNVFETDPRVYGNPTRVVYEPSTDGIVIHPDSPNVVFIHFRLRADSFVAALWDRTKAYAANDQRYYDNNDAASGDHYIANVTTVAGESPQTDPTKWDKVSFPRIFSEFCKLGAYGDVLGAQKQISKMVGFEKRVQEALDKEIRIAVHQMQQWPAVIQRVRAAPRTGWGAVSA